LLSLVFYCWTLIIVYILFFVYLLSIFAITFENDGDLQTISFWTIFFWSFLIYPLL
jgi:hypothetical protein